MPELIVKRHPCNPVMVPVIVHHRKVYPLQGLLSDLPKSNLYKTLPVDLMGNVAHHWHEGGIERPHAKSGAP